MTKQIVWTRNVLETFIREAELNESDESKLKNDDSF